MLLLEHPPCSPPASAPSRTSGPPTTTPRVIDVDRGGKITFHGPGQLVGYPIVRLPDHVLVVDYVRRLEEALIGGLRATSASPPPGCPGRSGVWLQADDARARSARSPRIGIRVSRGVTMHGFALNCDVDLSLVRPVRALRHRRRRRHLACPRSSAAT